MIVYYIKVYVLMIIKVVYTFILTRELPNTRAVLNHLFYLF